MRPRNCGIRSVATVQLLMRRPRRSGVRARVAVVVAAAMLAALGLPAGTAGGATGEAEVRIAAQRLDDGRTEFALQVRPAGGAWGERLLPARRFLPAIPTVGRWLASSPLEVQPSGAGDGAEPLEVRTAARRLAGGRIEFALQPRAAGGAWGRRLLPARRLFPANPTVGRWLVSSPLTVTEPATAPDAGALAALYHATDGPNWTDDTNWLTGAPLGEWHGVTVDGDGRVTGLELPDNGLSGPIPPELADLDHLTELQLHRNQLTGEIPPELAKLANLTVLRINRNRLSGNIPVELAGLTNLTELWLAANELTGPIPPELGDLANLTRLRLNVNRLSGNIPVELADLADLTELWLHYNQLSGNIPVELAGLTNLTRLSLSDNQLSGRIPPQLADLTNLEQLWLARNRLSGNIPVELARLTNLTGLSLDRNQLTGPIPVELAGLANLTSLFLGTNRLTGEIPPQLGNLTNLEWLWIDRNQLTGRIPAELGNLTNLVYLRLNDNLLSGRIPAELGNLTNLTDLELNANELSGQIPPELGNLTNLTDLRLLGNRLTGRIPAEFGNLTNLTLLRADSNRLSGAIPAELGNLINLEELWLDHNRLTGPIPPELGNLANLRNLQLGGNRLSGEIPPELADLSNLERLWLHNNRLTGEIPPGLATSPSLRDLRLDGNQLGGAIPDRPVPVRLDTAGATPPPSGAPLAVTLAEAFGGRGFEQPVEIATYPVGPGAGPGVFVADREGRILLLHPDGDDTVELLDISERVSTVGNEEGLLSVALDPRFEETGHLWLYYSVEGLPRATRLSRFTADLDDLRRVDPGSEFVVMEIGQPNPNHHGGSIRFGPDGMLYLGLGDGGSARESQNLASLAGSVIRIDVREASSASPYAVPHDNPFVEIPGARPEIWAYGFRNPWRMAFDPDTGALWLGDVGSNEIEEIDRIKAGGNYGWNRFEGTRCVNPAAGCDPDGTVLPVAEYRHHLGCSVTGGVVYRGKAIPALAGHYLFADFCRGRLWALPLEGGDVVEVAVSPRSISSFGTDAGGEVYVLTFWGAVLRLVPPSP